MSESFVIKDYTKDREYKMTGEITKYTETTALKYPYLFIECTDRKKYKLQLISNMMLHSASPDCIDIVHVYLGIGTRNIYGGYILRKNLKLLLQSSALKEYKMFAYLEKSGVKLEGNLLYAMCTM